MEQRRSGQFWGTELEYEYEEIIRKELGDKAFNALSPEERNEKVGLEYLVNLLVDIFIEHEAKEQASSSEAQSPAPSDQQDQDRALEP